MSQKGADKSCDSPRLPPLNLYKDVVPDPAIHGEGPFVAALPPKDRVPCNQYTTAEQFPIWHSDCNYVGHLYETDNIFKKKRKGGCISLIYEQQLRQRGVHGYSFTVLAGDISAADGVGFAFGSRVPCSKNIKRLWSIFVNRAGRITKCMNGRLTHNETPELPPITVGQILSMVVDLNQYKATFETRLKNQVLARKHVDLADFAEKVDASSGYLCAAVARAGIVVRLLPAPTYIMSLPEMAYNVVSSKQNRSQIQQAPQPWPFNVTAPEFFPKSQNEYSHSAVSDKSVEFLSKNDIYVDPLPLLRSSAPIYPLESSLQLAKTKTETARKVFEPLYDDTEPTFEPKPNDESQNNNNLWKCYNSWLLNERTHSKYNDEIDNNPPLLSHNTRAESALTSADAFKLVQKLKQMNPDLLISFPENEGLNRWKNKDFNFDDDELNLLLNNRTFSAPSGG